ncbi:MAG TPA: MFS transporter [Steroidobacteraceae bacterium]|jgi:OPA family glycerol-3-phosphate transporter-like MFS transporter|nr:MFS transporter [Steroidobacteraceae bacterium]
MIGFLRPAPFAVPLAPAQADRDYPRLRRRVFVGIYVGYAAYYLVRSNLALALPDVIGEHPGYTKTQLGTALSLGSIAYGLSKFLMGSVSDRSNPKYFLPLGLLLSSAFMAALGLWDWLYTSLLLIFAIQTMNGWVQGMGWPPCGKTIVHWFSAKERGMTVAVWNTAHNVGGSLVAVFAILGLALFHDWHAKFYFNALLAATVAVFAFRLLEDAPQSRGLPSIERYRNDYPAGYSEASERTLGFRAIFFQYVLPNRYLWAIAVANAFCYFVRYGVENWIPTYLQISKGFDFKHSGIAWGLFEGAGIPGTIICGWVSERWFRGKRAPATILFMALTLLGIVVYWLNGRGPLWIDYAALLAIGFLIYGPIMIIGLHSLDLVPKKAAGTAAGFTGVFGYMFGAALSGTGVGWIADRWSWGAVFASMVASCVLTMLFSALTLGHKLESEPRPLA